MTRKSKLWIQLVGSKLHFASIRKGEMGKVEVGFKLPFSSAKMELVESKEDIQDII